MLSYASDEDTVATAAKVCEFIVGTGEGVHVHRRGIAHCFTHASGAALAEVVTHFARRTSRDRDALHTVLHTAEKHCVADLHVAGVGLVCAGLGAWWVADMLGICIILAAACVGLVRRMCRVRQRVAIMGLLRVLLAWHGGEAQ